MASEENQIASEQEETVVPSFPGSAAQKGVNEETALSGDSDSSMKIEGVGENPSSSRSSSVAVLNGEVEVFISRPLPEYDQGPVKAYVARKKDEQGEGSYFAMICENSLVPNTHVVRSFVRVVNSGIVKLAASGVLYWPPAGEERYTFVYERNLGAPLMQSVDEPGLGWKQDKVMEAVIKPMVNVLLDLRDKDIVHGSIRPTNIYTGGLKDVDGVILGECLSVPSSFAQPAVVEPIHRAMVDPIGRGRGMFGDDLYSFGVSLAMILRSRNPLKGLSEREIIQQKIEKGSYVAVVGTERFSAAVLELLRGLLYDDWTQRWSLNEVLIWLDGQRLSPKQSVRMTKATRPFHFNKESYLWPAMLAADLGKNPNEAMQVITNGSLEQWVDRSLEDKLARGRFELAVGMAESTGRGPDHLERLVSYISMSLDPSAPIRYKGISFMPEAFPNALEKAFAEKKDLQPYVEIIQQKLISDWISMQQETYSEAVSMSMRFDNCRMFLKQNNLGYGIERCLYFLCPGAPCLSEKLKGYYVRSPEDLLFAFEKISARPDRPHLFIDRHIAAFLSAKERKVIDPYFLELNSDEEQSKVFGNLKCLATIQKREKLQMFPGIAGWLATLLDPVYEGFHDCRLRDEVKKKVDAQVKIGDLSKIAAIFDDTDLRRQDFTDFKKAMREYDELRREHEKIESKLLQPETFGKQTGQEIAAIFSAVLAGIIIMVFAFIVFSRNSLF